jgi:hypothetical protein
LATAATRRATNCRKAAGGDQPLLTGLTGSRSIKKQPPSRSLTLLEFAAKAKPFTREVGPPQQAVRDLQAIDGTRIAH